MFDPLTDEQQRKIRLAYRDGVLKPCEAVLFEAADAVRDHTRRFEADLRYVTENRNDLEESLISTLHQLARAERRLAAVDLLAQTLNAEAKEANAHGQPNPRMSKKAAARRIRRALSVD